MDAAFEEGEPHGAPVLRAEHPPCRTPLSSAQSMVIHERMKSVELDFQAWLSARAEKEAATRDDAFGEKILAWMDEHTVLERTGWAPELCERVATRLQARDAPEIRKQPIVYWSENRTALAIPGRYVYISRRLIEEAMPEDAVAFLFAHELAHHRLGHTKKIVPALERVRHLPIAHALSFIAVAATRLVRSREQEAQADAWALARCLEVGYDGHACLKLFDVLRNVAENYGDLDMAFGAFDPEASAGRALEEDVKGREPPAWRKAISELLDRGARTRWELSRGYPSIRDRRARLEAILAQRKL